MDHTNSIFVINLSNLDSICLNDASCWKLKISNIDKRLNKISLGISYKNYLENKNFIYETDKYNFFIWSVKLSQLKEIKSKNINFIAVDSYNDPNNF